MEARNIITPKTQKVPWGPNELVTMYSKVKMIRTVQKACANSETPTDASTVISAV